MARFGFSIVKSSLFRGVQQEFSNTYHYQGLNLTAALPFGSLVAELVDLERGLHSVNVKFLRARVWSAGGTPAENQMVHEEELTGTGGANGGPPGFDRERAYLIRWPAGKDIRGNPVYLRKWFHSCGATVPGSLASDGQLANLEEIPVVTRDAIAAHAEGLRELGTTETFGLCSATGREAQPTAECHRFLEHHQLGDMWR